MIVQDALDKSILKMLALEPIHGIARRIEHVSQEVFSVNAGSPFPAFRRLERQGRIKAVWKPARDCCFAVSAISPRPISASTPAMSCWSM